MTRPLVRPLDKVNTGFALRVDQHKSLLDLSDKTGVSLSELIRRAIDMMLGIPPQDASERSHKDLDRAEQAKNEALAAQQLDQAVDLLRNLPDVKLWTFERAQIQEAISLIRDLRFLKRRRVEIKTASQKNQLALRRAAKAAQAKKGAVDTAA